MEVLGSLPRAVRRRGAEGVLHAVGTVGGRAADTAVLLPVLSARVLPLLLLLLPSTAPGVWTPPPLSQRLDSASRDRRMRSLLGVMRRSGRWRRGDLGTCRG